MRVSEIGGRPVRGMVGMRMVEADHFLSTWASFTLDTDHVFRIDAVTITCRISACVIGSGQWKSRCVRLHPNGPPKLHSIHAGKSPRHGAEEPHNLFVRSST